VISRVRVILGNPAGGVNVVVVDDFIYGEPSSECAAN
jgi:hypothetical protein